jgi:hypothetical protein
MRKDNDRSGGVNIKVEELNGLPISDATTTLLRELTGTCSAPSLSVVAVACIIFSYFWTNEGPY